MIRIARQAVAIIRALPKLPAALDVLADLERRHGDLDALTRELYVGPIPAAPIPGDDRG